MSQVYLCVGPRCWGMSRHIGEAVRLAKKNYANFHGNTGSKFMPYDVYEVDESTYVDAMGSICGKTAPKKIREVRFVGTQRTVKEIFDVPVQSLRVS